MKEDQIKRILNAAIDELLDRDSYLLEIDANERAISHRLALYLEPRFSGWNVDCEYNRNHDDTKKLGLEERHVTDEDLDATTVYPDIIVHRRSTDENLLVIEMKKSSSRQNSDYDLKKLRAFRRQLNYKCAAFLCFSVGRNGAGVDALEYINTEA